MENLYYIRNEGYLGNALLWWTKSMNGYTCDINNALQCTLSEAKEICKRNQDTAYECEYINNLLIAQKLIIDCQYVDEEYRLFIND